MAYKRKSLDNRRKAKRNLERLLKEIESVPRTEQAEMRAVSDIGRANQYFMRLENVVEVHIYSEGPERWYADIVFKDVPEGYSNAIGTPVKSPVRSQADANDYAMTALIMLRDTSNTAERPTGIVFTFDDVNLTIPEKLYQEIHSKKVEMDQTFSEEYVVDLMERARARVGGPLTEARMNKASPEDQRMVLVAAIICSLSGHLRWPDNVYDEEEDRDSHGMVYPDGMSDEEIRKYFPWKQ